MAKINNKGAEQKLVDSKTKPSTLALKHLPKFEPLFPLLPKELSQDLVDFRQILRQVRPLRAKQEKNLPRDIFELSRLLTTERPELDYPYWS
ncbi:MAG: hypothetical protein IJS50_00860, partial [Desulfovibrio sp.]|nr:hypothetical protein [Desulfovibrio sp.]